ncbi:MAG: hypothetical protein IT357_05180 [Gemmatimonadaceae bacterium]|nr:hypothetical protein [Gemmatimonadaceae bacterium]
MRGPLARASAAVWLVLQLLIVGGLPIMDAGIEHREVVAHWEDVTDDRCPPVHGGTECVLHQTITSGAAPVLVTLAFDQDLQQSDASRPVEADRVVRVGYATRLHSRGPPAA